MADVLNFPHATKENWQEWFTAMRNAIANAAKATGQTIGEAYAAVAPVTPEEEAQAAARKNEQNNSTAPAPTPTPDPSTTPTPDPSTTITAAPDPKPAPDPSILANATQGTRVNFINPSITKGADGQEQVTFSKNDLAKLFTYINPTQNTKASSPRAVQPLPENVIAQLRKGSGG